MNSTYVFTYQEIEALTTHIASEAISPRCLRLHAKHTDTFILKQLEPSKTCYWFQQLEHQFFKKKKSRVRKSNVRLGSIAHIFFVVSTIWFDCRTQSNSIHGLGSIVFDWVRLKFSSIGFDLLHRDCSSYVLFYKSRNNRLGKFSLGEKFFVFYRRQFV